MGPSCCLEMLWWRRVRHGAWALGSCVLLIPEPAFLYWQFSNERGTRARSEDTHVWAPAPWAGGVTRELGASQLLVELEPLKSLLAGASVPSLPTLSTSAAVSASTHPGPLLAVL